MKNEKEKPFKPKKITNPCSSSGRGYNFEHSVQASFVVLMLTRGIFSPLGNKQIVKLEFQNRIRGAQTDDLTIYTGDSLFDIHNRMYVQIKQNVQISNNKKFEETIANAWLDFNNGKIFKEETDKLALITTPLSQVDQSSIRILLDFATGSQDENEFFLKLKTKHHGNLNAIKKLDVIRNIIKNVNRGLDISDNILWRFLKIFIVLIYDFDIKGVVLSLLNTIIGQYDCCDPSFTWCTIKDFVAERNEKEGAITLENIPQNIKQQFISKKESIIPKELVIESCDIDFYKNPKYRRVLAQASLIGSWSEFNENDRNVITHVINQEYDSWISTLQEIAQIQNSPIKYKNGVWFINSRRELLKNSQNSIYDIDLERLQKEIVNVLTEIDPKFSVEKNKRFYASVEGYKYKYSYNIQKSFTETVALLGCCSYKFELAKNKMLYFSDNILKKIFEKPTWELIATLNSCIPTLAESSPSTFIEIVNFICDRNVDILKQLIEQEGLGLTGGCYMSGILWALERLAWHPNYFTDSILTLAKLFKLTPKSQWVNCPENSIIEILMPWHYQTLADIEIQKSTMQRFIKEYPIESVKILVKLLPIENQVAKETNKPLFLDVFTKEWQYSVKIKDMNELVSYYITLLIEQTRNSIDNILCITSYLNVLSDKDFEKFMQILSSDDIINKPEDQREIIWNNILDVVKKHKRFKNSHWAMSEKRIARLEDVLELIKPKELINIYISLYDINLNYDLDDESQNYDQREEFLNTQRIDALKIILQENNNFNVISKMISKVKTPSLLSSSLLALTDYDFDINIYPGLLISESSKIREFVTNYSYQKYKLYGYQWLKQLHFKRWSDELQILLFKQLPFNPEVWRILDTLKENIKDTYWKTVVVKPYQNDSDLELIKYLLDYNRPLCAVECVNKMLYEDKDVKSALIIDILNRIKCSEEINDINAYAIAQMIKKIQFDSSVDFETKVSLEWKFYPILDNETKPLFLKEKLKRHPEFFCELICILYKPEDESLIPKEPVYKQSLLSQVWNVLNELKPLAGYNEELNIFDSNVFLDWFNEAIKIANKKTRLDVTLNEIGQILFYAPADIDGFWINKNVADLLNESKYEAMRRGFSSEIINSRGIHWVDPFAKEELNFARKYHEQALACRRLGYNRLAKILDEAELFYKREAERIIETNVDLI